MKNYYRIKLEASKTLYENKCKSFLCWNYKNISYVFYRNNLENKDKGS